MVVIGQLKPLILIDQVSINPILVLLLQYYAANQPLHHCSTHWHQLSNILCKWVFTFANKCTYYLKSQLLCLKLLQIKINKSLLLYLGISFISQPRVLSLLWPLCRTDNMSFQMIICQLPWCLMLSQHHCHHGAWVVQCGYEITIVIIIKIIIIIILLHGSWIGRCLDALQQWLVSSLSVPPPRWHKVVPQFPCWRTQLDVPWYATLV